MDTQHPQAPHTAQAIDPWCLTRNGCDPQRRASDESLFALANGTLGVRGGFEEHASASDGSFLAAAFEQYPLDYHERLAGFARSTDTRVPVCEGKRIRIVLGDDTVDLDHAHWLDFRRTLDLRHGQLRRILRLRSAGGHTIEIRAERVVPLTQGALLAIRFGVTSVDYTGPVRLVSLLETSRAAAVQGDDPRIGGGGYDGGLVATASGCDGGIGWVRQRAPRRGFEVVCGQQHRNGSGLTARPPHAAAGEVRQCFDGSLVPGQSVQLEKMVVWVHAGDPAQQHATLRACLSRAVNTGFDGLAAAQSAALAAFWQRADISIPADPASEQALRVNLFHLLQSAGRNGIDGTAAKGLTGEGYEGHCFWDTESFVLPVMALTAPEVARAMLQYRYRTLDAARAHAREMNHPVGALYPWRTIAGGECSAHYPSGSAAYHINADLAFAIGLYLDASDDVEFLLHGGAEMLFETARIWPQAGHFNPRRNGAFCIHEVTGPDEYTTLVNNNFYTNRMAQQHLYRAVAVWQRLQSDHPQALETLAARLQLHDAEIERWQRIADAMELPYADDFGIYAQDDGFLDKPRWPYPERASDEHRPLLLDYHPLTLNRYQICKQGDVIMALVLAGGHLDLRSKRRSFDYYQAITTHDSTLSASTFGILACEVGLPENAWQYFTSNLRVDLDNLHGNTDHGVHMAALAGSWLGLVFGFAGLRIVDGQPAFSPTLPAAWPEYHFHLNWRGCTVRVDVAADGARYHLVCGQSLAIFHDGIPLSLPSPAAHPLAQPQTAARAVFPRPARALIFDLDGVLTDTANLHYAAWKRLADELGIPFDRNTNERLKGIDRMASLAIILEHGGRDASLEERNRLAERKNGYYLAAIGQFGADDVFPGARRVLESARAMRLKTALASASRNAATLVQQLGIADLFDAIVDAGKIRRGKPDPEIFLAAAAALGVAPAQCIGIEDAAAGIRAIHAAGMAAVGIGSADELAQADMVFARIAALDINQLVIPPARERASIPTPTPTP